MADLTDYHVVDGVDDVLAVQYNRIIDSTVRGELSNIESLTANKTLTDADFALQIFTPTAARDVTLPAIVAANHPFYIVNASATYALTVKNADGTTIGTVAVSSSGSFASDGVTWHSFGGVAKPSTAGNVLTSNGSAWTSASLTGAAGYMRNGYISPTVTSNNLTVAIKTLAGTDPSATNPVVVRIGNVDRIITSALSVTKNAGTNWAGSGSAGLATKEADYFVYVGYNTSDGVTLGFSRIPFADIYSDFSTTSTNEKYGAISNISNAAANDTYMNIGRFAATLSAGAGYTWTVPAYTSSNLIQRPIFVTRSLSYSPALTNLTIGNGTISGSYILNNNYCSINMALTFGSTTSIAGSLYLSQIPFTEETGYIFNNIVYLNDSGTAAMDGLLVSYTSSNTKELSAKTSSGAYVGIALLSSTVPFTWTTNDRILISDGYYKLA